MKAVGDKLMDDFEEAAVRGVDAIKRYFAYLGNDPEYFKRAKVGAMTVSAYARLRATETNRMALSLMASKASGDEAVIEAGKEMGLISDGGDAQLG